MRVVVQVGGQEAIPVRAIPVLTDWVFYTPSEVVRALADQRFKAYRLAEREVIALPSRWWTNWSEQHAAALMSSSSRPAVASDGYRHPGAARLSVLPAGVFVLKDEFVHAHHFLWAHYSVTHDFPDSMGADPVAELPLWCELDFHPRLTTDEAATAMSGFDGAKSPQVHADGRLRAIQEGDSSEWIETRKDLVAKFKSEWPTVGSDLSSASRNGLSHAAKAGARMWSVKRALTWARENKKLRPSEADTQATLATIRKPASPFSGL